MICPFFGGIRSTQPTLPLYRLVTCCAVKEKYNTPKRVFMQTKNRAATENYAN